MITGKNWRDTMKWQQEFVRGYGVTGWFAALAVLATMLLAGASARGQTVTPTNITIGASSPVFASGTQTNPVQICLPPGSTINKVDVCLLLDDTGSFKSYVPTLTNIFASLVTNLEASVPGVEFGFGVTRFCDFGGPGDAFSGDYVTARPFTLNQPIITAATAGGSAALITMINTALGHTGEGYGGDAPEAALCEGLWQVATGVGLDGDGDGSMLDSGPAGSLEAQTNPGDSGDVPPFSSNVLPTSGTLGGVGWRAGALHLVILANDNCPVSPFPYGSNPTSPIPIPAVITNAFGLAIATTAFECPGALGGTSSSGSDSRYGYVSDSYNLATNTVPGAVAPVGSGTVQGTVNALNALGIRVMCMGPGAGPTTSTTPVEGDPYPWFSAIALLTGAVDGSGNPLVFSTSVTLPALATAIVNSVSNTTTLPISITLAPAPTLPPGLGLSFTPPVVSNVVPGGCASFTAQFTGVGAPTNSSFNLDFVSVGSGSVLGAIPVTVTPPVTPVTPTNITIGAGSPLCSGGSLTNPVEICLPPGSTINKVDVCLLLDDTGSFKSYVPTLTNIFASLVTNLEASVPGVEFGFGVTRFEDFGGPGNTFSEDYLTARPFILNQPIITAADAGGSAALITMINTALSHAGLGYGGDAPEASLVEGLYQIATGVGLDGDGDGSLLDSGPAGSLSAQTNPGNSGDVPPFSSNVLPTSGTLGGVGFRSDALHIVILASDVCPVAAFPAGQPIPAFITNSFGLSIPTSAFCCSTVVGEDRFGYVSNAKTTVSNTVSGAVAPSGSGTVQGTVNALNALGIRVITMGPSAAPSTNTAATIDPSDWFSAIGRITGAVDGSGNPLVFNLSVTLPTLAAAIVNSVSNTTTLPVSITLATPGLPPGLSASFTPSVVTNVAPGDCAPFTVVLTGGGSPVNGSFNLDFVTVGSGSVLGTIPVSVSCPNIPPVVISQTNFTVGNDPGLCSATITGAQVNNGSYSPGGGPLTFTLTPPPPYPVGSNVVLFTACDTNGLCASNLVTIVVVDTQPPTLNCGSNKVVECGTPWTFDVPTATDNCNGTNVAVTVVNTVTNPFCGGAFAATRTWLATDASGNSNACSQTVIVVDTTPPTVACPGNLVVEFSNETGVVVCYSVTAADTCSAVTLTVAPPSGSLFPIGLTPVRALAVDACGNSNRCVFDVTVLGARGVKSNILAELEVLQAGVTDSSDQIYLDAAIADMLDVFCPTTPLWIDETHVTCQYGWWVFGNEEYAVNELVDIKNYKKSQIPVATVQDLINRMVKCDRLLAVVSLDDAAKAGANTNKLANLWKQVTAGDKAAAAGKPATAIQDYYNAWNQVCSLCVASIVSTPDGQMQMQFSGTAGQVYQIQASTNLGNWTTVGTATADANGNISFTDPNAASYPNRFYRVVPQ
jgi:hypothetical protein